MIDSILQSHYDDFKPLNINEKIQYLHMMQKHYPQFDINYTNLINYYQNLQSEEC
jgi:hypothetical protein